MPKYTDSQRKKRQIALYDLVIKEEITDQAYANARLRKILGQNISLATTNRDFIDLKIVMPKGSNRYVVPNDVQQNHDKEWLKETILSQAGASLSSPIIRTLSVSEGYADLIGRKLIDMYPRAFKDYLPLKKLLILFVNNTKEFEYFEVDYLNIIRSNSESSEEGEV
jgi:arginine repressor